MSLAYLRFDHAVLSFFTFDQLSTPFEVSPSTIPDVFTVSQNGMILGTVTHEHPSLFIVEHTVLVSDRKEEA